MISVQVVIYEVFSQADEVSDALEAAADSNVESKPQEEGKNEGGETGARETELEPEIERGAESAPKITTTMDKSKMTIYLSCNNVTALKTFCEVTLVVCVLIA